MLPEALTATFLSICLGIFYIANLWNLLKNHTKRKAHLTQTKQPVPQEPSSIAFVSVALGTFVFWFGSIFYVLLAFTGILPSLDSFLMPLKFPFDSYIQILGVILTGFGYFLFTWSVIARGRYATAWDMPENHKLVRWGPYHYVRHPSYLAYFILFFGLSSIWLTWTALIPFVAIPGYVKIADEEEKMLTQKFGEEYIVYQKTVKGKFFPKRQIKKE
jgi:protein-S-isoprenylcysteine O-methyltransferase Ste14